MSIKSTRLLLASLIAFIGTTIASFSQDGTVTKGFTIRDGVPYFTYIYQPGQKPPTSPIKPTPGSPKPGDWNRGNPPPPPPPPAINIGALDQSIKIRTQELQVLHDQGLNANAEYYEKMSKLVSQQLAYQNALTEQRMDDLALSYEYQSARQSPELEDLELNPRFIQYQIGLNQENLDAFTSNLENGVRYSNGQIRAAFNGAVLNEVAARGLEDQDFMSSAMAASLAKASIDIALDFVPVVGTVKGLIEAATGYSIIRGEKLSATERVLSLVGAIPFGAVFKGAKSGIATTMKILKSGGAEYKAAGRIASAASKVIQPDVVRGLGNSEELAIRIGEAVESKIDDVGAAFRKMPESSIQDFNKLITSPEAAHDFMEGGKKLAAALGDEKAVQLILRNDPVVAIKTMKDFGAAERAGKAITHLSNGSGDVGKVFQEAADLNASLLTGVETKLVTRIDNASTLSAARRGVELNPKITRELPYKNHITAEDLIRYKSGRALQATTSIEQAGVAFSKGLKPNQVAAVVETSLSGGKVIKPSEVAMKVGKNGELVAAVRDSAFVGLEHGGLESVKFLNNVGKVADFGDLGSKMIRAGEAMPDLAHFEALTKVPAGSYSSAFGNIVKGDVKVGDIMIQVQSKGQSEAGHWFGAVRPNNPADAEKLYDLLKWKADISDVKVFVVKNDATVFAGAVNPVPLQYAADATAREKEFVDAFNAWKEVMTDGHQVYVPHDLPIYDVVQEIKF